MILKVFTDGGSKGNPGPSSIGMVFYFDGKKIFEHKENIGLATNNDAEYTALIKSLEIINQKPTNSHLEFISGSRIKFGMTKGVEKIEFYSDSRLMVNQVNGLFKVKKGKIKEYILKIRSLEMEINLPISYFYIPREKNSVADNLVNSILN